MVSGLTLFKMIILNLNLPNCWLLPSILSSTMSSARNGDAKNTQLLAWKKNSQISVGDMAASHLRLCFFQTLIPHLPPASTPILVLGLLHYLWFFLLILTTDLSCSKHCLKYNLRQRRPQTSILSPICLVFVLTIYWNSLRCWVL